MKGRPFVDPKSVLSMVAAGEAISHWKIAAAIEVCAVVPEEPASMVLTGVYNSSVPKRAERYTPADAAFIFTDPKRYYIPEFQKLTRAELARIQCPILILQGDVHQVNRFNQEVLIPELRALGKKLEVLTYSGEPHCFCYSGEGQRTPHPDIALKAFTDMESSAGVTYSGSQKHWIRPWLSLYR